MHGGCHCGYGLRKNDGVAGKIRRQRSQIAGAGNKIRMTNSAIFIDRDGTISEEVGYINHVSRFRVFPYSGAAIRLLNRNGWLAILVTNQAGVARGYFAEEMIRRVHEQLNFELELEGGRLDAI